jgi:SAM-dependent methyltransferase
MAESSYLLAGQTSELQRLQLQSRVWEPAARALLAELPPVAHANALEVGCGVMGWLRVLSEWVGSQGRVTGTDVDDRMLDLARDCVDKEPLPNVSLVKDDLFHSRLAAGSFDLVHARFQIAPLGRASEQLRAYRQLLKPGGTLVLEDPEMGSWRVNPHAPACERLIALIEEGFRAAGGDFNAGRALPSLLRAEGLQPEVRAHVVALPPGHPYLRLPLQFATSLKPRLQALAGDAELERLMLQAEAELAESGTWGSTFTLVQAFARA